MPWNEFFLMLNPDDPRNVDRQDPAGDRLRVRINGERGRVVDFAVLYETPDATKAGKHREVVRYDGSHGHAHYHIYDRTGAEVRKERMPAYLDCNAAVTIAIAELRRSWERLRAAYFEDGP